MISIDQGPPSAALRSPTSGQEGLPSPELSGRDTNSGRERLAIRSTGEETNELQARLQLEVVVPVFNEQESLVNSIERLHNYMVEHLAIAWRITIADNASTDSTWELAVELADRLWGVTALHVDRKGRGHALRDAWEKSDATVVAYLDVDLSTDLDALAPLIAPLMSGHSGIAIGTRLAHGASVKRGRKREFISRTYNRILHTVLRCQFTDAQCGFKALRSDVADALLPLIQDDQWFFDTELLVLAERNGIRIHEVPVDWIDDPNSSVDVFQTATDDLRGVCRLAWSFARGGGRIDPAQRHVIDPHQFICTHPKPQVERISA